MSDSKILIYSVISFLAITVGFVLGISYQQNKDFNNPAMSLSDLDNQNIYKDSKNEFGVSNMEKSFEERGISRCQECLIDKVDMSQIPTNWCPDGRIINKDPEIDELNNCYCPQLPECVK